MSACCPHHRLGCGNCSLARGAMEYLCANHRSERFAAATLFPSCGAGYDLLKKKADALTNRLRGLLKEIKATKEVVGREMNGATFAISEAVWAAGDFRKKVRTLLYPDLPAMLAWPLYWPSQMALQPHVECFLVGSILCEFVRVCR